MRVEVNSDVDAGVTDPALLPFGSYGPIRMKSWTFHSGAAATSPDASGQNAWVRGGSNITQPVKGVDQLFINISGTQVAAGDGDAFPIRDGWHTQLKAVYPTLPLRASASAGGVPNPKDAYVGADSTQASNNRHDDS